jgi:hypothetical protein
MGMETQTGWEAYLVPRIDSRERALELSHLFTTTSTKQIIIAIFYEYSVVIARRELIGVVT